jgi:hypothetical protein
LAAFPEHDDGRGIPRGCGTSGRSAPLGAATVSIAKNNMDGGRTAQFDANRRSAFDISAPEGS